MERHITNQTYILRLHVTTQMAQLLFPPRADLEAAHQAAVALGPPPPQHSRLGGGSTYTQLFKQRLTIVDESDRAWPVQVRTTRTSGASGAEPLLAAPRTARRAANAAASPLLCRALLQLRARPSSQHSVLLKICPSRRLACPVRPSPLRTAS